MKGMEWYSNQRQKDILANLIKNIRYNLDDFEWEDESSAWGDAEYNGKKYLVYISRWKSDSYTWDEDVANSVYDQVYGNKS